MDPGFRRSNRVLIPYEILLFYGGRTMAFRPFSLCWNAGWNPKSEL